MTLQRGCRKHLSAMTPYEKWQAAEAKLAAAEEAEAAYLRKPDPKYLSGGRDLKAHRLACAVRSMRVEVRRAREEFAANPHQPSLFDGAAA